MRTNCVRDTPFRDWQAALSANQSNSFWVGTRAGLLLVEQGVERPVIQDQTWGRSVDFLYRDRSGAVWMSGHSGELDFWDGQRWTAVDAGEGSTALSVICMEEDREGSLWMGTDQGLVQLRKSPVRTFTMRDGLAGDNAWSVCQSKDGTIWVGTDRGVSCIRADRVARLAAAGPLPESQARCLWPNPAGGVWIAKQGAGLQEFQDGAFFQRIVPNALPVLVSALYQDRSDRLLIGSAEGVLQFQRGEVTPLAVPTTEQPGKRPDFPAPASLRGIQAILEDRQGALWFGTKSQGLARLAQGVVTMFNRRDGLSHNSVWAIYEAADGALWLGTEGGLTRYRNGKCFVFSRQHGLGEETVNCVLEDDFGFLYLSGLHGILRIKRAELDAVADGRAAAVRSLTLGTGDGMESAETNGEIQPAGWKARDGRLWFCTIRGVVVIDPKAIPSEEAPPPVLVEQVKADEEVVFGDGGKAEVGGQKAQAGGQRSESHFQLRAGHGHVVEFRYTANTFVASERARFRYRLLGANRDWREETSERTARYINLKPGKYRFEVTAADHHGIWNPVPASFGFSLVPRFWQTWTFYVLCGSGVIGLAAGLQAYRLRWQRRLLKLEEQRALATERTRIARDLHDDLGTALTGLALELDVAGRQAKEVAPLAGRLSEAAQRTRDLAERMREVVWTVNPKCDTVSSLASFLEQQVSQFLRADGLRLRLDFPEDIPELPLGAEARHELALSVREALTNVVRHAQATEVTLSLAITDQTLRVQVKDNGRGFRQCQTNAHGLANMKARMERVRGSFECLCAPDGGTAVTFRLPLGQPAKQLDPNDA
jgi:signal transduction histidine kinase/ligand-binding sensor domain-containing protein